MRCPFCEFGDTQVKDSRHSDEGGAIKRRRQCPNCGGKFTTFERIETRDLKVKKRNGDIRLFDINKLIKSIDVATRKRKITADQIDEIIARIVKKLSQFCDGEIESKIIGELVLFELSKLDEVSYVRYASVYKDFEKAEDFRMFIANIAENKG